MNEQGRLPVNTVINKDQSIWHGVGRDSFRRHIIDLQRASAEVPSDPVVHSASQWLALRAEKNDENRLLPFDVEQRLADDLAFLAAAEEGPKEVSAVALEEQYQPRGLMVLLAANERIPPGVKDAMKGMFNLLSRCASRRLSRDICAQSLFDLVIVPNQNRIHGRFQSVHWDKPRSRINTKAPEPLHQGLRKVIGQLEKRKSTGPAGSSGLIQQIRHLCGSLEKIDQFKKGNAKGMPLLKDIVKESYGLCTSRGTLTLDETIAHYGFDPRQISSNKHIRQVNKIGRYWGLCLSMTEDSRRYPDLFTNLHLKILRPYEGASSNIALVQGQKARCLVHAEMQIVVFYGRSTSTTVTKPRVIGASKSACYLCNLFNLHHGQYFITKTHGHLYERWNFPDLAEYNEQERNAYRRILSSMDTELQAAIIRERNTKRRRQLPMGSWLTLPLPRQSSPVPSTVLSSQLDRNESPTPRAQLNAFVTTQNPSQSPIRIHTPQQPLTGDIPTPRPPSPPPAYTATAPIEQTRQIPSPTPQDHDLPTADQPPRAPSSSSIESWEYPIHRTITAANSFRKKSGKVAMTCDIEGPALGSVAIARLTDEEPTTGRPVNIGAMKENETLLFEKKSGEDCVVLDLQGPDGKTTQLTLRWL